MIDQPPAGERPDRRIDGNALRARREALGIPQARLARAAGMNPGHLWQLENGRKPGRGPWSMIETLAELLEVPVEAITTTEPFVPHQKAPCA